MLHLPDDSRLTPDQRRREVASILARGVLRLRSLIEVSAESVPPDAEHAPADNGLEVSAATRPHVTCG
jgi:hypothetical protein